MFSRLRVKDEKIYPPEVAEAKAKLKKKVEKYMSKEARNKEIQNSNHLHKPGDNFSEAESTVISKDNRRDNCKFNISLLYEALLKDPAQRTESDVKDLRLIFEQFDFVKNHEP